MRRTRIHPRVWATAAFIFLYTCFAQQNVLPAAIGAAIYLLAGWMMRWGWEVRDV